MTQRRSLSRRMASRLPAILSLLVGTLFVGLPAAGATPPANGEPPTLSGMEANGDVYVGSTLYAHAGRWSGAPVPTYSYRWQYQTSNGNWPDIAGATAPTYTVQPSDLGYPLRVNVTATNSDGNAEQVSTATIPVTNAPDTPPTPPDPPPDVLGSPLNSRVVSSDGLLVTRAVTDYRSGQHPPEPPGGERGHDDKRRRGQSDCVQRQLRPRRFRRLPAFPAASHGHRPLLRPGLRQRADAREPG